MLLYDDFESDTEVHDIPLRPPAPAIIVAELPEEPRTTATGRITRPMGSRASRLEVRVG